MRSVILGLALAFAAMVFPGGAVAQTPIAEGQVWTFKSAPAESARVVIQKIERWEGGGEAVHVSLYGLPKLAQFSGEVSHMPFERKALEGSLDQLTNETPREDIGFAAGYREWQTARGGIFTLSISEALKAMLVAMFGPPHRPDGI